MAEEWNVGDVVQLKSGGPEMTVNHVSDKPHHVCTCVWFHGHEVKAGKFRPEALRKVEGEGS